MSPLEHIADQLAGLIEPRSSADRHALAKTLTERLFQLVAVPPVPLNLRLSFGNPFDAGVPLLEWCKDPSHQRKTSNAGENPLLPIASLLDALGESETPLLVFVPAWFRVDERGRPLVFPPQLSLGVKTAGEHHLSEKRLHAYAHLLHPSLLKTLAHCDVRSSLLYSFGLFLARAFLDVDLAPTGKTGGPPPTHVGGSPHSRGGLAPLALLRRCRFRNRTLPPELPELLYAVLSRPLDRPPGCTCRELAEMTLQQVTGNPFVCQSTVNLSTEHEVFAYSVFGLNKPEPTNEDRVLVRTRGAVSFALVADGVSLVDLGTGEMAAEEIVRLFRARFQARFDGLAQKLTEQLQNNPSTPWTAEFEQLLREFFQQANERMVSLANQLRDVKSERIPLSPLCATLTVAVVVHDQALLAFVGDSPALLFRPAQSRLGVPSRDCSAPDVSSGRLSQLSTEDHVGMQEDYEPESGVDPQALTRVIGQCRFSERKQVYEPIGHTVPVVRAQLQPGDLLLLGSDGLVECINEPTAQDRFTRLEEELQRLHVTDQSLKQLVVQLIRLGEDGLSNDNISVTAVRVRGAIVLDAEPVE